MKFSSLLEPVTDEGTMVALSSEAQITLSKFLFAGQAVVHDRNLSFLGIFRMEMASHVVICPWACNETKSFDFLVNLQNSLRNGWVLPHAFFGRVLLTTALEIFGASQTHKFVRNCVGGIFDGTMLLNILLACVGGSLEDNCAIVADNAGAMLSSIGTCSNFTFGLVMC